MSTQAEFVKDLRAAVDQLFAHRKALRRVAVRCGFWPEGLVISAALTSEKDLSLWKEIVPWDRLATMDAAELMAIADRVCAGASDAMRRRHDPPKES
jgi:hypothetical protein